MVIFQSLGSPDNLVKSFVVEGEASESDEEAPAIINYPQMRVSSQKSEQSKNTVPKSISEELLQQMQQDLTDSLVQVISDSQQTAVEDLSQATELLLNTQVAMQRVHQSLHAGLSSSRNISNRLDDILSLNFIPKLYFGPGSTPTSPAIEKR